MAYTLIAPIMGDLEEDENGTIVLGRASKRACVHAITEARRVREEGRQPLILLTATVPDRGNYKHCTERMGKIAERYINAADPTLQTRYHEAKWFITIGEIVAIAEFLEAHEVKELLLPVKWFHAIRVWVIAGTIFRRKGLRPRMRILIHWAKTDLLDVAHEVVGVFVNALDLRDWRRSGHIPRVEAQ